MKSQTKDANSHQAAPPITNSAVIRGLQMTPTLLLAWTLNGTAQRCLVLGATHQTGDVYKVTDYYSPDHDRKIRYDDLDIAIDWPIA